MEPHLVIQLVKDTAAQYSLYVLLAVLLFSCLANRVITGLQSQPYASTEGEAHRVRKLAYWVPGLGHAFSFVWSHRAFLLKAVKTINEPVVALQMGTRTQYFIYSPSMAQRLFDYRGARSGVFSTRIIENFVGDRGLFRRITPENLETISRTLTLITEEPYLEQLSSKIAKFLERETANLVSFNRSLVDQAIWERNAGITVEEDSNPPVSEGSLFALTRSFTTYITTQIFMGQALLDFHPGLLEDLWLWDREFVRLSGGTPRLLLPGVSAAHAARERTTRLMSVLQASFLAVEDGRDAPMEFRDLDDVSELMQQRIRLLKTLGLNPTLSGRLDSWLLWKLTSDSSKLTFWTLFHAYSDPTLLSNIRKEIAPFVKTSRLGPKETGLPFMEPPRLSMDMKRLLKSCPLLKATYAESVRLETNPISYRELTTDLVLTESPKEAAISDLKEPRFYEFHRGDVLAVPCGAHHIDPTFYPEPQTFDPTRFISVKSGKKTFDWQGVLPFGGDDTFASLAEREVLAVSAAIISLWDIDPVSAGGWKHPGHRLSANAYNISHDVRVRLKHRI
ncbi:putative cytochrome P450 [Talaromyces proteolyticus]|uniref:Cytochrome P450 n=1 Tax=Talaromyces proteolyticus TaxID=1131652 RepID=A0AAD4Q5J7_9EURO|nr:putative cytochrome P450 [Talaromyces proteolyticus]KAH8704241.1 putative cytochrome P450 [Talaromyces proteolyticus]